MPLSLRHVGKEPEGCRQLSGREGSVCVCGQDVYAHVARGCIVNVVMYYMHAARREVNRRPVTVPVQYIAGARHLEWTSTSATTINKPTWPKPSAQGRRETE